MKNGWLVLLMLICNITYAADFSANASIAQTNNNALGLKISGDGTCSVCKNNCTWSCWMSWCC